LEVKQSQRAHSVKLSPTLSIASRAAHLSGAGRDILDLSASESDFDLPPQVRDAVQVALAGGALGDAATDLEAAIVAKFERDNDLHFAPAQVLVSNGARHSLYNLMQALLNEDDEVIVPAPYWPPYPDMARLAGADPVIVRTRARHAYKMTPEELRGALGPRSRLLILNSPCNPSGAVYGRAELAALGHVLEEFPEVVIASDDVYEHLRWNTEPHANILNVMPRLHERTIVINGLSKSHAMSDWRVGWAAGPAGVIAAMRKIRNLGTAQPALVTQVAAVAALEQARTFPTEQAAVFRARHARALDALRRIPDLDVQAAEGAFYLFPDLSRVIARLDGIDDDVALAQHLLETAGVAVLPGTACGMPDCLRISCALPDDELDAALERLVQALS
jgi:aspartate aminotransferase